MSRWVYLLGVGLALVALALTFTDWALSLKPGVTEANARRVRPGMALAEVKRLFGRAADDDFGGLMIWYGSGGRADVRFNADRQVDWFYFFRTSGSAGPLARPRAWLGW